MPAKAQPPPQPKPPTIHKYEQNTYLTELPFTYLLERSSWSEFRRALNTCGLTWNIPDWMCTIVHGGPDYEKLKMEDEELDVIFKHKTVTLIDGDESKELTVEKAKSLIKLLGFTDSMSEYVQLSAKYCNLGKLEFEPDSKLPARQKMWSWIVKCLSGGRAIPGPYYYLVSQVPVYDISGLFKRLMEVIETVTICSLDDEVYNVTHLDFDPSRQDIFGYLEELRKAVRRLAELNEKLPKKGRVEFSEAYIRSRLVRAARQVPTYKSVIDNLVIQPIKEWSEMSLQELSTRLESAQANDLSLVPKRNANQSSSSYQNTDDNVKANFVNSRAPRPQNPKSSANCFEWDRSGTCKGGTSCSFAHPNSGAKKPEQKNENRSANHANGPSQNSAPSAAPSRPCSKCGIVHGKGQCKKKVKCTWCGADGHQEEKCFSKKGGKPKILFSDVGEDGVYVSANLVICDDSYDIPKDPQPSTFNLEARSEEHVEVTKTTKTFANVFLVDENDTSAQLVAIDVNGGGGGSPTTPRYDY